MKSKRRKVDDWSKVPKSTRQAARRACFAKDQGHCRIRGPECKHRHGCSGCAEELDHIVPLELGGALLDPDNHRTACRPCNRRRRRPKKEEKPSVAGPSRSW